MKRYLFNYFIFLDEILINKKLEKKNNNNKLNHKQHQQT
jgi:hypothetical protein